MKTVLFCIPLKKNCLEKFKNFVKQTSEKRSDEWKAMLARYDMSCVKIWYRVIAEKDYIFVYHETGPQFKEKIKGWNDSKHSFDNWFNQQIMEVYDSSAVESRATELFELFVNSNRNSV